MRTFQIAIHDGWDWNTNKPHGSPVAYLSIAANCETTARNIADAMTGATGYAVGDVMEIFE